jgi:hypothetical protein
LTERALARDPGCNGGVDVDSGRHLGDRPQSVTLSKCSCLCLDGFAGGLLMSESF